MADEPVVASSDVTEQPVNAEETVVAEPNGGDTDPQAPENEGEHKPKKLGGWQRKQLKAEAEAEYWRNVALESLQNKHKVEEKPVVTEDKRPRKEDFIVDKEAQTYDPEAYEEALLAWNRRQTKKEVLDEIDSRELAKSQKTEQQKQIGTWSEEYAKVKGSGEFEDIDEVFENTPIVPNSPVAKFLLPTVILKEAGRLFHQKAKFIQKCDRQYDSTNSQKLAGRWVTPSPCVTATSTPSPRAQRSQCRTPRKHRRPSPSIPRSMLA
jgi:hypothetical protein